MKNSLFSIAIISLMPLSACYASSTSIDDMLSSKTAKNQSQKELKISDVMESHIVKISNLNYTITIESNKNKPDEPTSESQKKVIKLTTVDNVKTSSSTIDMKPYISEATIDQSGELINVKYATFKSGMSLSVLPHILLNGNVITDFDLKTTELNSIETFNQGNLRVDAPVSSESNMNFSASSIADKDNKFEPIVQQIRSDESNLKITIELSSDLKQPQS